MPTVIVTFLTAWPPFNAGETAGVADQQAAHLIGKGIARRYDSAQPVPVVPAPVPDPPMDAATLADALDQAQTPTPRASRRRGAKHGDPLP